MEAEFIQTVNRRTKELEQSSWLRHTFSLLDRHLPAIQSIKCLAIGSPSEWPNSQYQLAFLRLLADRYNIKTVTVWDPKFEPVDAAVFAHFGAEISEDSTCAQGTLLYVPHGPRSLNLELGARPELLYLGNTMRNFMAKVTPQEQAVVDRMAEHEAVKIPVDRHDRWYAAMSDLALININS